MSTESRTTPSGGRESVENLPPHPYPPHFYPPMNYQGMPQPPWFPGQPPVVSSAPWSGPWGYGGPTPAWSGAQTAGKISSATSASAMPSDEYTVDTMRRIYNDDDGRVEIQRVKVQRRHPEASAVALPTGPDAMSLVPVGSFPLNERRPPPRKNKMKRQLQLMQSLQGQQGPYPCYPYMPCMPYPYPYPYYYGGGCMWPPSVVSPPMSPWPGSDDSERTTSRQESLPTTLDSQRLESRVSAPSRNSLSPSPSGTTHSVAPSDSVFAFGYKDEESLKVSLRGPTPPPRSKSRACRALMAPSDVSSDVGDRSSFATASTDLEPYQKLPPKRKNRASKLLSISNKSSSLDQKDTDSLSDRTSVASDMTGDEPSRLSSELNYAFKKFEQSVDVFKTRLSVESTPINTPPPSPPPMIVHSSDTTTETNTLRGEPDMYVSKLGKLEDFEPSSESLVSLPQLETASTASLSSSLPPLVITDTPVSRDVPSAIGSIPEQSLDTGNTNVSVSQTTTSTVSSTVKATDIATKASDGQEAPTSAIVSALSASPVVTVKTSSQGTQEERTNLHSEQGAASESQTAVPHDEKVSKDPESTTRLETRIDVDASNGRESRASSSTFFSLRPSDDPLHIDTDSTDIFLPTTDVTTADEGGEGTDWTASSPVAEDNESYQWVLQQPGEIPDLDCSSADREDERRNAWRAEVSLWRARLVVSLCRGRGLDRQDWATFHLLVHHPLTLDLKLSMLHAPRLCVTNSTIGAALVRVALIHLAQQGEMLLQPEANRQHGWRSIKVDPNQSWAPVKGAVEILKALGYREREDGILRYPRRSGPEVSVLARLTLDMLVLAEELRLYLTGTHQYPTNISDLFFPASVVAPSPMEGAQLPPELARPPSSTGSYSFMSAHSNTSLNNMPASRASSLTDEDTETLQASVRHMKSHSKKTKHTSSSEEEVTLKEEFPNKHSVSQESKKKSQDQSSSLVVDNSAKNMNSSDPAVTVSLLESSLLDNPATSMCSLPDLQSVKSSTISLVSQPLKASDSNGSVTPVATPTPDKEDVKDNPEEHIYEEIDVIRQQVQALRSASVPVDIQPPPLPPKKKVSSGEDDSGLSLTYPHMEWTTSSMPGSLRGGSTGARRKKRRAPMPPDFMPQDWKPYENRPQEVANVGSARDSPVDGKRAKSGSKRSLNPFYEDIDSVKAQVKELNKAYEKRRMIRSGKVDNEGNPFNKEDYVISGYVGKNPFYEDIDEDASETPQNNSRSSIPSPNIEGSNFCAMGSLSELQDESILLKNKRKAPKPPTTPEPTILSSTPQPSKSTSPQPPKIPPPRPPSSPVQKSPSSPQPPNSPSSSQPPKSPSSPQPPKSPSSPQPPKHSPTTPPPKPPPLTEGDTSKQQMSGMETSDKSEDQNSSNKPDNMEIGGISDHVQDETSQAVSKTKTKQQKLTLQHPTIPPPPPPPKLDNEDESLITPNENTENKIPMQNTAQTLLDDIPYMDANEVYTEKVKTPQPEVSQYEIPELPGKDGIPVAPPLSPTVLKQTALLLSGHRTVPFIDESDLPPDSPPPPPPTSPPESPPETPHVSPPETPHTSPPETPLGSPVSSPLTIQVFSTSSQETAPIKTGDVVSQSTEIAVSVKETPHQSEKKDTVTSATTKENSSKTDSTLKASLESEGSKECNDEAPPLPPKTLQLQKSGPTSKVVAASSPDPMLLPLPSSPAPQDDNAMQSSISEDRYEIPETLTSTQEKTSESSKDSPAVKTKETEDVTNNNNEVLTENASASEDPPAEAVEERYEIPEVVKETALSIGPEGMPVRVGGPTHSYRMDLESVFGPPKPPRRRRNLSLPPPRPPKSLMLDEIGLPKLPPKAATTGGRSASASTTASFFTTASSLTTRSPAGTPLSFQLVSKPVYAKPKSKTRRSWPLLFCDCMYANCRNYDAIQKK